VVALKSGEIARFLERPTAGVFLCLIHGADAGLVSERARQLARGAVPDPDDPFQLVRMDGDEIGADPSRLANEAYTVGLFGGRRILWIEAGSRTLIPAVTPLLADPPPDCFIVIEAGVLRRDAPLRKLVEQDRHAAALECYPDTPESLEKLVDQELRQAGLSITPAARSFFVSLLGEDRLSSRAEIDKLVTYAHGDKEIDHGMIEAVVADASVLAIDQVIEAAFSGQLAHVGPMATHVLANGGNADFMLGQALRHATSLHRAQLEVDSGTPAEAAIDRLFRLPPHRRRQVVGHLRLFTTAVLLRMIDTLAQAVGRVRREPRLTTPTTVRALWTVARSAKAR
jgi:DNA polymerase-3 subunit delta